MDEEHCVIAIQTSEVAKFNMTADKRRYNVFLICPAARPLLRQDSKSRLGFGWNDTAKVLTFPDMAKYIFLHVRKVNGKPRGAPRQRRASRPAIPPKENYNLYKIYTIYKISIPPTTTFNS